MVVCRESYTIGRPYKHITIKGTGFVECTRRFGFTRSAWNKAIGRGALDVRRSLSDDRRRRHNWADVQVYYDAGASMRECKARFGFCSEA
jgi:hypothetical protein